MQRNANISAVLKKKKMFCFVRAVGEKTASSFDEIIYLFFFYAAKHVSFVDVRAGSIWKEQKETSTSKNGLFCATDVTK